MTIPEKMPHTKEELQEALVFLTASLASVLVAGIYMRTVFFIVDGIYLSLGARTGFWQGMFWVVLVMLGGAVILTYIVYYTVTFLMNITVGERRVLGYVLGPEVLLWTAIVALLLIFVLAIYNMFVITCSGLIALLVFGVIEDFRSRGKSDTKTEENGAEAKH